jgi:ATP-binding cassette subfamily B protein
MLAAILNLGITEAFRIIVDCGFNEEEIIPESCSRYAIGDINNLGSYFKFGMIIGLGLAIFSALRFYFISILGQRVIADIRKSIYAKLTTLSSEYFERIHTGEVLSRLTTDTTLIETVIGSSISFAIRSVAVSTGALIWMFFISWELTLMVAAIGPIIIIPALIIGRKIRTLSIESQDSLADASARAGESISAIQTVQAFNREIKEISNFNKSVESTFEAHKKRIFVRSLMTFIIFGLGIISIIGVMWYGASFAVNSEVAGGKPSLSSGQITQFIFLAFMVVSSTGFLTSTWTELLRASGATQRIMELLKEEPVIKSPLNPKTITVSEGNIEFKNVSFSYPTRSDEKALNGINLSIKSGEKIAFVGPSGAGKTTIFQLLLRFYDIQTGSITIDGIPIKELTTKDLRKQFSIVQQSTPLFSGSAIENITYGSEEVDLKEAYKASKMAFSDSFIKKLPQGYDTDLGEAAERLSGGQKQRVAIARSILRDAPVLLLDEATSSLDSESEHKIQKAIETMSRTKTTLIIAHRLATVVKADKIVVMEKGKIIETGSHKQLLRKKGLYSRLSELQFKDSKIL